MRQSLSSDKISLRKILLQLCDEDLSEKERLELIEESEIIKNQLEGKRHNSP